MQVKDFYSQLNNTPQKVYNAYVNDNSIVIEGRSGKASGNKFNPVTLVAFQSTGVLYKNNKRETQRAGRALGLSTNFTNQVYDASKGVTNRGNAQVVRGRVKKALGV